MASATDRSVLSFVLASSQCKLDALAARIRRGAFAYLGFDDEDALRARRRRCYHMLAHRLRAAIGECAQLRRGDLDGGGRRLMLRRACRLFRGGGRRDFLVAPPVGSCKSRLVSAPRWTSVLGWRGRLAGALRRTLLGLCKRCSRPTRCRARRSALAPAQPVMFSFRLGRAFSALPNLSSLAIASSLSAARPGSNAT